MSSVAGFTMMELLVVLVLVAVLVGVAAGLAGDAVEKSRSVVCVGNLRQWGVACGSYVADHDGDLPRRGQGVQRARVVDRPEDWFNALPPYLGGKPFGELVAAGCAPSPGDKSLFVCPSASPNPKAGYFFCYGMNMYLSRWDKGAPTRVHVLPAPGTLALMADSPGGYASTVPSALEFNVAARHHGRANVLFLDGRVQSFPGGYLGCGRGDLTQPDVRWQTLESGDTWRPGG